MAKSVRGDVLIDLCEAGGFFDGFLHGGFVDVVTTDNSSVRIFGKVRGRKNVLPDPVFVCIWVFAIQGVGQVTRAAAVSQVFFVDDLYLFQVKLQGLNNRIGQDGDAVIFAFAIADDDLMVVKVNIFDAQAQPFYHTESAAVHDLGDEFVNAGHVFKDAFDFVF